MQYRAHIQLLMDGRVKPEGAIVKFDDEQDAATLLAAGHIEAVQAPPPNTPAPQTDEAQRAERISAACAAILEEARVEQLTAAGLPTVEALESRLNEAVSAAERNQACKALAAGA